MGMDNKKTNGVFLDVDSSIVEKNLRFATDPQEEEMKKMFGMDEELYPAKYIKPKPGFCIKTHQVGTDRKLFINVCQTDNIPPPPVDLTETELMKLLSTTDETNNSELSKFRIPMSIGELRKDTDKSNNKVDICDVAINTGFFRKISDQPVFKQFFGTAVFEALNEKYGVVCKDTKIILQNRKSYGTLQTHRIQDREMAKKMQMPEVPNSLGMKNSQSAPSIEVLDSVSNQAKEPEYRLYFEANNPTVLMGQIKLPDVISIKNVTVDIGEDRIVVEETSRNYLLDIFVPHSINQRTCLSSFNKMTRILTLTMPLLGG